jgi:hypothetical protein
MPALSASSNKTTRTVQRLANLLLEHLFNLADFLLKDAGDFLALTFGCQIGVVRDLAGTLFDFAFQLV